MRTLRQCGECTACCYAIRVKTAWNERPLIRKAAFRACSHQDTTGCTIYSSRPRACRQFTCSWLAGRFEDTDRPDRSGVVVEEAQLPGEAGPLLAFTASEAWPAAFATEAARTLLQRLQAEGAVVAFTTDRQMLLHDPGGQVARAVLRLQRPARSLPTL